MTNILLFFILIVLFSILAILWPTAILIAGFVLVGGFVLWVVLFLNSIREDLKEQRTQDKEQRTQDLDYFLKSLDRLDSLSPPGSAFSQAFYDSLDSLDSEGLEKRLDFYKTLYPETLRKELRKKQYDD